jgi:RHH-type rel operon transcriptional repressor/antitoxin RelB
MKTMIAIRLPEEIDNRLKALAERTGRTKTWYAREAILRYIEDLEDTYIALDRLENPAKRFTMEEAEKVLVLDDGVGSKSYSRR